MDSTVYAVRGPAVAGWKWARLHNRATTSCSGCEQDMTWAIPEFVGIPAPAVACCTTAHGDLHWANLTSPLRILDWEGRGRAPQGFDAATLYAYTLLKPDMAARVRDAFPILGSRAGLAAEATVCAQLLQTVARGGNLILADPLRGWSEELRRR